MKYFKTAKESKPETLLKLRQRCLWAHGEDRIIISMRMYHCSSEIFPQNVQIYSSMIFFHALAVLKTISKLSRKLRKEKEYFPVIKLLNRNRDKLQKVEL